MKNITVNGIEHLWQLARQAHKRGRDIMAICPAHNDTNPSLAIGTGDDGRILLNCKAGCSPSSICSALGIDMKDLFAGNNRNGRNIIASYDYRDESGNILYQVCRTADKQFPQRKPDGSWGIKGISPVLYRLPELIKADNNRIVFITEGEKDCDNLRNAFNLIATTAPMGAGKWKDSYNKHLKDRRICIIPDCDPQGRDHALDIAQSLLGTAKEIRILELPGDKKGYDISDWIAEGGTKDQLKEIFDNAKEYKSAAESKLWLQCMADIEPEEIEWLWDNKIVDCAINTICGNPDAGKSFFYTYITSHITTGTPFPDCPDIKIKKSSVIIFSDEDHPKKVIRPRLDANKADVRKVYIVKAVHRNKEKPELFDITKHLQALEETLKEKPDCRLVVIDPITAYLGDTNANSNAEIRAALTPLSTLAEKYKTTILAINHLNKRQGLSYIYRSLGSMGLIALSRSVWAIKKSNEDEDVRIFAPVKANYSVKPTGLKFRIIDKAVVFDSDPWHGKLDDELREKKDNSEEVAEWLKARLQAGAVLQKTLEVEAEDLGFTKKQLWYAKDRHNIKSSKEGFGKEGRWLWRINQ